MRVFISWSGELSRQLGEAIRNWLPSALQYVKPYFTPSDVDKGAKWASEIFKELSSSSVCIIVLTRENLKANWIMFEAGAISTTLDNARVCPLIFDLDPTDLQGPLAQFQATTFSKEDFRRLFTTINSSAGESKLADAVAESVFNKWWPDLEETLTKILKGHMASSDVQRVESDRDLIEEILLLARTLSADRSGEAKRGSGTYDGSFYQQLIMAIDELINSSVFGDRPKLHRTMVSLKNSASRRFSGTEIRPMLADLAVLVENTKWRPDPDDDDEIPF